MFGPEFEDHARERIAARRAEVAAFAEARSRIRAAGVSPWAQLFGIVPRFGGKPARPVATPAARKPVRGSR